MNSLDSNFHGSTNLRRTRTEAVIGNPDRASRKAPRSRLLETAAYAQPFEMSPVSDDQGGLCIKQSSPSRVHREHHATPQPFIFTMGAILERRLF